MKIQACNLGATVESEPEMLNADFRSMRNGTDNLFPFVSRCIVSVLCRLIWYKLVGEPAFIEAKPKLPALPKGVREL